MKKYIIFGILIFSNSLISSQTIAFHENFEAPSFDDSVTSTQTVSGIDDWHLSSALAFTGSYSDSCSVIVSSVAYLTSAPFSTLGKSIVYLDFAQICKVDFLDNARIEISVDNGNSWSVLGTNEYLGNSLNFDVLERFSSASYGNDWIPGDATALPDNSWWREETFDLSSIASDKSAVQIRFQLQDGGGPGGNGNYGWLIDDIVISVSGSELDPPLITLIPPVLNSIVYNLGPFNINAQITDASGIDTALFVYNVNSGLNDTIGMTLVNTDTFEAVIPPVNDQDVVCYQVIAYDASVLHNMAKEPLSSCISFIATTGLSIPYYDNFDTMNIWTATASPTTSVWELGTPNYGATSSAFTPPNSWDINLNSSYKANANATLTSPVFDFSGAVSATLSLWMNYYTEGSWDGVRLEYTTDGTTWSILGTANDTLGVNWYNYASINSSGLPAWAGNSNGWVEATYDLSFLNYNTGDIQFRFIFTSDGSVQEDGFSIDNFAITLPASQDVAVDEIIAPVDGCGLGNETVSVNLVNEGLDTINGNLEVGYYLTGGGSVVIEVVNDIIPPSQSYVYNFSALVDLSVVNTDSIFEIVAFAKLLNDPDPYNDTINKSINSGFIPPDPIVSDLNIPYGTDTTLIAFSFYPVSWWDVPVGGTAIETGSTFSTPVLYGTTVYYVDAESTSGLACRSDRVPDTVFVSNVPPVDASTIDIISPVTGFNLTSTETVTVIYKNYGTLPISSFPVCYSIDGGIPVVDTIYTLLNTLDTVIHNFSVEADLSAYKVYEFKAWVNIPGDTNRLNDTITVIVENKFFDYCDSYATSAAEFEDIGNVTISNLNNGNPLPVSNNPTAINGYTDFTNLNPVLLGPGVTYPISVSQISLAGNYASDVKVYLDYNRNGIWDLPQEMVFGAGTSTNNLTVTGDIIVPVNAVPGITMMRVVLDEANGAQACGTYPWGETEDYLAMIIPLISQDAGVVEIIQPQALEVEASTVPVQVIIKNYGTDTLYSMDIAYKINGGTQVSLPWTGSLAPTDSDTVFLPGVIVQPLNNSICVYTILTGDSNGFNDEKCKDFYGEPVQDAQALEIITPVTACGLGLESVTLRIVNVGLNDIIGNLNANYNANGATTVTEVISNTIAPGDTLDYVFSTTIDMSTTIKDSIFDFVAWVDLAGDPISNNDTTYSSVKSAYVPPPPGVSNVSIPYGTTASLTALSPDSIYWFDVPVGGTAIQTGPIFTTPVLYATTVFYVEAHAGIGELKITEITQHKTGTGQTPNYPPDVTSDWDGVEIANLGGAPLDLSGYTFHVEGATTIAYTFPNGIVLNSSEVLLLTIFGNGAIDNPANNFYVASTSNSVSSNSLVGYYVNDNKGVIIDAVATNGYSFSAFSGVTSSDWSGNILPSSGFAGVSRIISDNNNAADWIVSSTTNLQTIGTMNPGLAPGTGDGCVSTRVPDTVFVGGIPPYDVCVTGILEPVSGYNLTGSEIVTVEIKNNGSQPITDFPVSYTFNGSAPVTDTVKLIMQPGDTLTHQFSVTADLSSYGLYAFKAYSSVPGDTTLFNDTAYASIENMMLTYCPSYATTAAAYEDIGNVTISNLNNGNPDPINNNPTAVNGYSDFTNLPPVLLAPGYTYPISVSQISLSSNYSCDVNVYIDFNMNGVFDLPDENAFSAQTSASSTTVTGNVTIPSTSGYGLTGMRVVLDETTNAPPCGTYIWGETEDYLVMLSPLTPYDAGVIEIQAPVTNFLLTTSEPVTIKVKNFGAQAISDIPVYYSIDGGTPVLDTIFNLLNTFDTFIHTFSVNADLSAYQVYNIKAWASLPGDTNTSNDTAYTTVENIMPNSGPCVINAQGYTSYDTIPRDTVEIYPGDTVFLISSGYCSSYLYDNFQNGNIIWQHTSSPMFNNPCPPIVPPASGIVCWIGSASSFPRDMTTDGINIPGVLSTVEFDMKYGDQQTSVDCEDPDQPNEGVHLQYSIDGGVTWTDINYWTPTPNITGPLYTWNHYYELIPVMALSPNSQFRWFQDLTSGFEWDHWGLDNIEIKSGSGTNYQVQWNTGDTTFDIVVFPQYSQYYTVTIYDSINSASDSVYVKVNNGSLVFIDPVSQTVSTSTNFTTTVEISQAQNLGGFELDINFDTTFLTANAVTLGGFLASTGRTVFPLANNIDNINGFIEYAVTTLGSSPPGPDGDGVLLTIEWTSAANLSVDTTTYLLLQNVQIIQPNGTIIPATLQNASVSINPCYIHDFDCDCDVDIVDISMAAYCYGTSTGDANYNPVYDLDSDGDIDIIDITMVAYDYGWSCTKKSSANKLGDVNDGVVLGISSHAESISSDRTFVVEIYTDNINQLGAYEFSLNFDQKCMEVLSMDRGDLLESTGRKTFPLENFVDNENGTIRFAVTTLGSDIIGASGSGTLLKITCNALSDDCLPPELTNVQLAQTDGEVIEYKLKVQDSEAENSDLTCILNCYPNPFNEEMTIQYRVANEGKISFKLYDIMGKMIMVKESVFREAGTYEETLLRKSLNTGLYFYFLEYNDIKVDARKVLVK